MTRIAQALTAGLLLVISCRSPEKPNTGTGGKTTPPPAKSWQLRVAGEVERVNLQEGYIIVKCTVLPSDGEEATVYRQDERVGRIRFTGSARPPYMTADILEGRPQRGDRIRE